MANRKSPQYYSSPIPFNRCRIQILLESNEENEVGDFSSQRHETTYVSERLLVFLSIDAPLNDEK